MKESGVVGNKAFNLSHLKKNGYVIPETFVCISDAHEKHRSGENVRDELREEIESLIPLKRKYSVRSSADIEDSSSYSFAGQFKTHLSVEGIEGLLDSIEDIWASSSLSTASAYLSSFGVQRTPRMAVILQEMITSEISGVIFTRNPITGLDEEIVELVKGCGRSLVQDGVTPERWVKKWGGWIEAPDNKENEAIVNRIIRQAKEMSEKFRIPLDLEWVFAGEKLYWLQMRKITTLRNVDIYSNRISREFLPGIIKPLIWSVNIPVVNSSWKRLFKELIGGQADRIDVNRLAKSFYYRAYFNMGVIGDLFELLGMPREALEILAGIESPMEGRPSFRPGTRTIVYLPRMIYTVFKKLFFSNDIERFLRNTYVELRRMESAIHLKLGMDEAFDLIDELFEINTEASYFVIVSQLLNSIYNTLLSSRLKSESIDIEEICFRELSDRLGPIDPRQHLSRLNRLYMEIPDSDRARIHKAPLEELKGLGEFHGFSAEFEQFMKRFGHLSDSGNDFSRVTWRENPEAVLAMIAGYPGADSKVNEGRGALEDALGGSRVIRIIYSAAVKFRVYRESVNFLYTYGYGLFRRYFLAVGDLMVGEGLLSERDDVFYLTYRELRSLSGNPELSTACKRTISECREEIERHRDLILPEVIYNELPESLLIADEATDHLRGVATAKGHYVGPVRVVRGVRDFGKIREGDVLVIPFSDVSWTPLFSKARAVVSESGGILSHCSIVAREYGIPAVVSVSGAMKLADSTIVAVDGYQGEVRVLEEA